MQARLARRLHLRLTAKLVCTLICTSMAVSFATRGAERGTVTGSGGNIPEGMWHLNRARSVQLEPADQTLWVIKDDGKHLIWVLVSTDQQGEVRINSWSGAYGGEPAPVMGSPMRSQIVSRAPGTLHNSGEIAGLGSYSEDCEVMQRGRRFVCHGEVTTASGVRRWTDDFDWIAPSPR
jgi:hypothetical protein